jgi:alpha-L-fucosidase
LAQTSQPALFGLVSNNRQIEWFHREQETFIHFNVNTFTGNEWGAGTENPDAFNPTNI